MPTVVNVRFAAPKSYVYISRNRPGFISGAAVKEFIAKNGALPYAAGFPLSPYASPFTCHSQMNGLIRCASDTEAVARFRDWLLGELDPALLGRHQKLIERRAKLIEALPELRRKLDMNLDLGCWCVGADGIGECHGWPLLEIVTGPKFAELCPAAGAEVGT